MINKNTIFQLILIVVALTSTMIALRSCHKEGISDQQKKALVDTTVLKRNDKGQLEASKLVFVSEDLKEAKAEIERLKVFETKFTRQTKQLTSLKREFEIYKSGTVTPPKTDTIYIANTIIETPSVSVDTGDQFHRLKFAANKSKYAYEVKITDNSELKVEEKKKETIITLLNKNPYVTSVNIKSVAIAKKKPSLAKKLLHVGIGLGIGYIVFK